MFPYVFYFSLSNGRQLLVRLSINRNMFRLRIKFHTLYYIACMFECDCKSRKVTQIESINMANMEPTDRPSIHFYMLVHFFRSSFPYVPMLAQTKRSFFFNAVQVIFILMCEIILLSFTKSVPNTAPPITVSHSMNFLHFITLQYFGYSVTNRSFVFLRVCFSLLLGAPDDRCSIFDLSINSIHHLLADFSFLTYN